MRVLVTGANGFIGRHLCTRLLDAGLQVTALVRHGSEQSVPQGVDRVRGDITVHDLLPRALEGADAVAHLAGVTEANRSETYQRVNVEGTVALAHAALAAGVRRFVFVSSLAAQGPSMPGAPHRHGGDEAPLETYGRSKLEAERRLALEVPDLPVTVLRPAVVYGPGDRGLLTWMKWVRARLVPVVPDLEMSFVHVADLCALIQVVVEREDCPTGPFFVSDGRPRPMGKVTDTLERLVASAPAARLPLSRAALAYVAPIFRGLTEASGLGARYARAVAELAAPGWACLPDRARVELGFEPVHELERGLAETVDWYRREGWLP